ncbi:MAG: N-acetyltransferase [Sphingobacteriales bacterium]|nr:MAG: N-acetyltransferase [Sphingobacteriales bacterium]
MTQANKGDKNRVVDILSKSFIDNKSVNYIIRQDTKKEQHIRALMAYSFDICHLFGTVFLTDDKMGCALILLPDKKKTTLTSILMDIKLAISAIGLLNIKRAMTRESAIKKIHPNGLLYYLWFIGVDPEQQGKGIGSELLNKIIEEGISQKRTICLETSTLKNIPWYEKHGFKIYKEMEFGYTLFCMKREQ